MLVKINLDNVKILNREAVIEQLQKGNDKVALILKPTWYAEYASICNLWSVPGWTEEELKANAGLQNYQVFLKGNGEFSIDLELDDIEKEYEDEDDEDDEDENAPCIVCGRTDKFLFPNMKCTECHDPEEDEEVMELCSKCGEVETDSEDNTMKTL